MKVRSLTRSASPKPGARMIVAIAFGCRLLFLAATLLPVAGAGEDEVVVMKGEKMSPDRFFQFVFDAQPSQTYPVAVSVDLQHWELLTNVVAEAAAGARRPSNPPLWVEDQDTSRFPQRFYHIGIPEMLLPTPVTNMVFISPGTFIMGSSESEPGHDPSEGPQTVVTLSRGFWMGKYEVTQAEYVAVMGTNISVANWDWRLPADSAKFFQATDYCSKLTKSERAAGRLPRGYIYRLPTEAEWEYACRAGTTGPVAIGDGVSLSSTQANFDGTFPYGGAARGPYVRLTTRGGIYPANAWGLYDMHGNLWEWCQDWYGPYPGGNVTDPKGPPTGVNHVLRGGGFTSTGQGCRSAKRDNRSPTYGNTIQGFRVVLVEN